MSGFLGNLINEFTHQGGQQQQQQQQQGGSSYGGGTYQQQQSYGGGYGQSQQGPPQVYPPWRAVWEEGRWLFINEQTGQRTFEHPGSQGNYSNQGYSGGYNAGPPQASYEQTQAKKSGGNHNLMYGAMGAAAGLAGGALLMHEGHEVKEKWEGDEYRAEERVDRWEGDARRDEYRAEDDIRRDEYRAEDDIRRDEYRAEDRMDRWGNDIENAPENAARWTGEKVQEVEDIPQDIEDGWDRLEDKVEDFPDRIAGDIGEDVGRVERFDDNIDNAYDAGRDEQRYDDDNRW